MLWGPKRLHTLHLHENRTSDTAQQSRLQIYASEKNRQKKFVTKYFTKRSQELDNTFQNIAHLLGHFFLAIFGKFSKYLKYRIDHISYTKNHKNRKIVFSKVSEHRLMIWNTK